MIANVVLAAAVMAGVARAQVTATGTMGPTNPPQATMGTNINQTSMSRLISLNAIDDFCLFGPPDPNSAIGNSEAYEVAWCVQPRNNARVIPDGTFTSVHFVKTPLYWQIQGMGDLTKLNIQAGDDGGELDPHGATGDGNPVGGNVTTNATGQDVHYQEWMNYMAANMFCLRICIAENSTVSAALQCQHTLDEMGCNWVMPGDYTDNIFDECDGDSAYPPGLYPEANGSTSTFAQRYTGTYTDGAGAAQAFTVGQTVTPSTPFSIPATSNCKTYSTISNGIASLAAGGGNATKMTATMSGSMSSMSSMASSGTIAGAAAAGTGMSSGGTTSPAATKAGDAAAASGSASSGGAMTQYTGANYGPGMAAAFSMLAVVVGASALLL